jgi:uncharacterized protein (DUF58 family)
MKEIFRKIKKKIVQPAPRFASKEVMDERELLKKVKKIEIAAKSRLNLSFSGNYQTTFRGKGLEFDRVREYQEKDEVRSIDWNVTARTGKLYVKNYNEERELNIYFLVDVSSSAFFQFKERTQREIAAEICCCLGFSALQNLDKIGLLLFTDKIEKFLKAKKGKNYILQIVREILKYPPQSKQTNMAQALDKLNNMLTSKSVIFLISDFLDQSQYPKALQKIGLKHEVILIDICVFFQDLLAQKMFLETQDMETGQVKTIDTYNKNWREHQSFQREQLQKFLNSSQPLYLKIKNYHDPISELAKFLSPKSSSRKIGQTRTRILL